MLVEAAGGVVTRSNANGELEFLVVHRPRYGDWSLPKGKLERGESFEDAAVREVEEETGVRCTLGHEIGSQRYVDRHGRNKLVRYWHMTPVASRPRPADAEVDGVRWVSTGDAAALLSYDADRQLIAEVIRQHDGDPR